MINLVKQKTFVSDIGKCMNNTTVDLNSLKSIDFDLADESHQFLPLMTVKMLPKRISIFNLHFMPRFL